MSYPLYTSMAAQRGQFVGVTTLQGFHYVGFLVTVTTEYFSLRQYCQDSGEYLGEISLAMSSVYQIWHGGVALARIAMQASFDMVGPMGVPVEREEKPSEQSVNP